MSNSSTTSRLSRASVASKVSGLLGRPEPGMVLSWDPRVGDELEAAIGITLRAEESMDSAKLQKLARGTPLRVEQLGRMNLNRVKVRVCTDDSVGWVSILDKRVHKPLLGQRMRRSV